MYIVAGRCVFQLMDPWWCVRLLRTITEWTPAVYKVLHKNKFKQKENQVKCMLLFAGLYVCPLRDPWCVRLLRTIMGWTPAMYKVLHKNNVLKNKNHFYLAKCMLLFAGLYVCPLRDQWWCVRLLRTIMGWTPACMV
jgi:hypothetical protein